MIYVYILFAWWLETCYTIKYDHMIWYVLEKYRIPFKLYCVVLFLFCCTIMLIVNYMSCEAEREVMHASEIVCRPAYVCPRLLYNYLQKCLFFGPLEQLGMPKRPGTDVLPPLWIAAFLREHGPMSLCVLLCWIDFPRSSWDASHGRESRF